jgi:hypothetical protein
MATSGTEVTSRNTSDPRATVFICHARTDIAFVDMLDVALRLKGYLPLMDRGEAFAVEDWWERIEKLIVNSDHVIVVLSPDLLTSSIALRLVEFAASTNKRLAPIVHRRVDIAGVPPVLRRLNFIFFDDPARFDESMGSLDAALRTDVAWIRMHTRIGELASEWTRHSRHEDYLITGQRLLEAEQWIASQPAGGPLPTPTHLEFLKASRDRELSRSKRSIHLVVPAESSTPRPRGSKIFISYRRSDTKYMAGRIYDELIKEFPQEEVFFDINKIPFGVNFRQHISGVLDDSAVVLALIGERWSNPNWKPYRRWVTFFTFAEDFVQSEIELSLDLRIPLIPVLLDDVRMPTKTQLPKSMAEFASLNAATVRSGRDFQQDMALVRERIRPWAADGQRLSKGRRE